MIDDRINVEAIKKYMEEKKYKEQDILKVTGAINRLVTIFRPKN